MVKPYLVVITGRPGSGKTTLAGELSRAACLPVISRDRLKEGYVRTMGVPDSRLPGDVNRIVTELFFETIEKLIDGGVSLIAEAAFQHKVWSPKLGPLMDKARVRVIVCSPGEDGRLALERFLKRGLSDPMREYFHGDKGVHMAREGQEVPVSAYEEPRLDAPAWHVDTSDGYRPGIEELAEALFPESIIENQGGSSYE